MPTIAGYFISLAGTIAARGQYCESGTNNSKKAYAIAGNTAWLYWSTARNLWCNYSSKSDSTAWYTAAATGDGSTPPLTGWAQDTGMIPVPTVISNNCGDPTPSPNPVLDIASKTELAWVAYLGGLSSITGAMGTPTDAEGTAVSPVSNAVKRLNLDSVNACRPCILVSSNPALLTSGVRGRLYIVPVNISAMTYRDADKSMAVLDAIWANVEFALISLLEKGASLSYSGLTFEAIKITATGKNPPDGSNEKNVTIECQVKTA